ncbi:MAG: tetratricopeptide repeat protein [Planctomycetota bacterium]|nr:MAG: tetratricopeptide repeat protein [Planctomycetota bacterium]REJ96905.1 MAG: tetratricopeptide repeat protein [Planctomycetota bacterium]REK24589.1 MAG: tetratricopeptide repeat protein [Planctomycetota bacterium]REK45975.1 MAG: tetratricopeptide repeat protein [Planctomycetota bacterium]
MDQGPRWLTGIVVLLAGGSTASAQPPNYHHERPSVVPSSGQEDAKFAVGQRVVATRTETLEIAGTVVGHLLIGTTSEIVEIRDAKLRVRAFRGWVPVSAVVDSAEATNYFGARIRREPDVPRWREARARVWIDRGQVYLAIAEYSDLIERYPEHRGYYRARGFAYWLKGLNVEALADFDKALEIKPDAASFAGRGKVRLGAGNFLGALQDFDNAILLDRSSADPYNDRAWLWSTCPDRRYRDAERAVASAREACKLTSYEDYTTIDTLAAAHARAGDYAAAMHWQTVAIKLAPENRRPPLRGRLSLYEREEPYTH